MKDSITRYIDMSRWLFNMATALLFGIMTLPAYGSITFTPLGDLDGGDFYSIARAVSNNGIVVGRSQGSRSRRGEAFRWTVETGMQSLGELPGGEHAFQANGISADGTVIVAQSSSQRLALRWTASGGLVPLSDPLSGQYLEFGTGISADGRVVLGRYSLAARWTETHGLDILGDLPGGGINSVARAASFDGSVVVGNGSSSFGTEAFRWTEADGMVGLGDLPGGEFYSEAADVSADGSVIVGYGVNGSNYLLEPFRWTEGEGMVSLGGSGFATGVSGDGKLIVGGSNNSAFIWDETNGMRSLQELVENAIGELTGWTLSEATGISDNGRYIVGQGRNPNGSMEGWLIDLGTTVVPEPLSVLVWGGLTCFAALVINRRSRV